ncbi:MAG: CSLREA domain-containing protein [Chloroflexota bacterium]
MQSTQRQKFFQQRPTEEQLNQEQHSHYAYPTAVGTVNNMSGRHESFNARPRRGILAALCFAILLLSSRSTFVQAATITVNSLADTTTAGDGNCTLREAINNVNTGSDTTSGDCLQADGLTDTINLPAGMIILSGAANEDSNAGGDLDIQADVILNGSADGTAISGGSDGSIMTDRVLHITSSADAVALNDLTITDGRGSGPGSGIFNDGGTVTVTRSTISENSVPGPSSGGGIYNKGTMTILNSTVSGNESGTTGGGMQNNLGATLLITNGTVTDNFATGAFGRGGGGIFNALGAIKISGSLIAGNSTTIGGQEVDSESDLFFGSGISSNGLNLFGHAGLSDMTAFAGKLTPSTNDINATSDGIASPLTDILDPNLSDNGGPTFTHRLVTGSPAIDGAGVSGLATDQRGTDRPQGTADDIGAFELLNVQSRMSESLESFTYDADFTENGANLGTLSIDFNFLYNSGDPLDHVVFEITTATNAFLQVADDSSPGGIGATLTIDNTALPDDISPALDLFEETETLTTSFIVGVENVPWTLNFEMYANEVFGAQVLGGTQLTTLTVDSSMFEVENQPQIEPLIFLPLIGQ